TPITTSSPSTTTSLFAVSALVRKAKEAELRSYIQEHGIADDVKEHYAKIQAAVKEEMPTDETVGKLQERLHRRKGTLTVIAEYKRKLSDSGAISDELFIPQLLSGEFREFGAQGIAVLADERMGGCSYDDLHTFVEDQRRAHQEIPGPVPVINSDVIVDEFQLARTAAIGADAVVLSMDVLGADEEMEKMLKACRALELEAIVAVSTNAQAQQAIDIGARMISVVGVPGADDKEAVVTDLNIPEGATVTTIANILHRSDKGLAEVEEAWECRDKGFNCAWISDALYKSGNTSTEHPGAIIKSMSAKSSVRWASPVARSGRGEGAREYLGDIMM
ncbi:MAG: hypothetical protein SGARI_006821, partial [Bacillariaceae sp.]